ncbi:MAG TPA: hypothetical protein VH092_24205 [Urbifossiella sp.]|nr:hypothetical protein [Urbifossiella sp.]
MSPAATAAALVRDHALKADDLVVHVGCGGAGLLAALRALGCRVLAFDPAGPAAATGIDALRTAFAPAAARLVRDRYGPAKLLLAAAALPPAVTSICLAPDGVAVIVGGPAVADPLRQAA